MRSLSARMLAVLLIVGTMSFLGQPAPSVTRDEVDAACASSDAALARVEHGQARLDEAVAAYADANARLEQAAYEELGLRAALDDRSATVREARQLVSDRAVDLYMAGAAFSPDSLFAAPDMDAFLTGREAVAAVTEGDLEMADELEHLAAELEVLRADVDAKAAELVVIRQEAERWKLETDQLLTLALSSYWELSEECSKLYDEYQAQLRREAAARAARAAGAAGGIPPEATPGFLCPMSGPIAFINDWGFPRSGGRTHKGTDVFAPSGHPQLAVADGTVQLLNGGLGGIGIWLNSDYGVRYYYAHLSAYAGGLIEGQRVTTGDVVGYTGNTGNAATTPSHLHFGIRDAGGGWVNPYPTLARNCG
ncbi:MAG: M23 family metallopeptidase [Acidimicrobiia bacterium]|nr:M23 family metallopeptidase [Acidimicrobiia bacterium]